MKRKLLRSHQLLKKNQRQRLLQHPWLKRKTNQLRLSHRLQKRLQNQQHKPLSRLRHQLLKFPKTNQSSLKSSHLNPRKRKPQRLKRKKHLLLHQFLNLQFRMSLSPNPLATQSKCQKTKFLTSKPSKRKSNT